MSSDVTIDAGELTAFGRRVAAAHAMAGVSIAKAVKKGLRSSRRNPKRPEFQQQRRIARCSCEIRVGDHRLADIRGHRPRRFRQNPRTRAHGPHRRRDRLLRHRARRRNAQAPEHYAEEELPTLAEYVGDAADDMLIESHRIMSVMDMTSAVLGMIPGLDQPVYLNQEPDESEMPPWVIATCTTDGHRSTEAARYTAHVGRLEIRVVVYRRPRGQRHLR